MITTEAIRQLKEQTTSTGSLASLEALGMAIKALDEKEPAYDVAKTKNPQLQQGEQAPLNNPHLI